MDLNIDSEKCVKLKRILDQFKEAFRSPPRDKFLETLAIHLAPKFTTHQVKQMLHRAVETLDHFPSIAQLEEIAREMNMANETRWHHKTGSEDSCRLCHGCGWVYAWQESQRCEVVVACDDCPAGKNLQIAPDPYVSIKLQPGLVYLKPGIYRPSRYKDETA